MQKDLSGNIQGIKISDFEHVDDQKEQKGLFDSLEKCSNTSTKIANDFGKLVLKIKMDLYPDEKHWFHWTSAQFARYCRKQDEIG